jgi:plastocyanin
MRFSSTSRALLGFLLGISCLSPAASEAGTIKGTLAVTGNVPAIKAGSESSSLPDAPRPQVCDAVIYLDDVPEKVERELAEKQEDRPIIGQFEASFIPRVTAVVAGTTIRFENQDRIYHNVFSVSPANKFDVGKLAPRNAAEVRFEKPGVVQLYNDLEPGMSGFVLVLANHAFVQPDSTGAWSFEKLPKGRYRVKVWHPTLGTLSRTVEAPRRGDVTLALKY